MIQILINHLDAVTLGERVHTIAFTVFVVLGTLCLFLGPDAPTRDR